MQIFQVSIILALTSTVTAVWRCQTCSGDVDCQQFPYGHCVGNGPGETGVWDCNSNAPCLTHDNNDIPNLHWCVPLTDQPGQTATCT
ncbi:unnamed protein product [Zymoseptoria tritici ST99CH_1A5]|uniref:CBM1 domain-containing protein n=3 Tax=Zymoseptoria tritici TaxID=1047171 RepID=A0A1X7S409_ZYMT9|nr:unnamed protein product [Zymoseptoria tritici ST99CH_3D7]SMR58361.1 unnamed protein product [Zymoseptoria tritici ST99CH_1E4]SMR61342.1 unnamed protein product [Zymoseptoria tritici ST99CH_3D1]SMY27562.1 unnamed protein product [Zymoseptoria tritici ST99CH_1A5]